MFAVPLAILHSTGEARLAALAFVIEWIPRVLGFPILGAIIDSLPIRRVLVFTDSFRAVVTVSVAALLAFVPTLSGTAIFLVLSSMMALMAFAQVTNFLCSEVTIPNNLLPHQFPGAHSATQGIDQASQVIGPLIAAGLYGSVGVSTLLLICGVALAGSAANYLTIAIRDSSVGVSTRVMSIVDSNREACRLLIRYPSVLYLSGITWVVNLVFGTTLALAAAITLKTFNQNNSTFGGLQSAAAICAILTFAVVSKVSRSQDVGRIGRTALAVILLCGAVMGTSDMFSVFAIGYCALIAFDGAFNVYIRTLRSVLIPKEHLGKVMGIVGLVSLFSMPLGGGLASVLSGRMSLTGVILTATIIAVALLIPIIVFGKRQLGYQRGLPNLADVHVAGAEDGH